MANVEGLFCIFARIEPPANDAIEEDDIDRIDRGIPVEVEDVIYDMALGAITRLVGFASSVVKI